MDQSVELKSMVTVNDIQNKVTTDELKSFGSLTDEDEVRRKMTDSDILNDEKLTNLVDYTELVYSSKNLSNSDAQFSKVSENPSIREALSHMTVSELDQFLNVYKIITSPDPNIDKTLTKASMQQLLSGELLDIKDFDQQLVAKSEKLEDKEVNKEDNNFGKEHTFFDAYDHIEGWKKRMQPMFNIIEDLAQECKMMSQKTLYEDNLDVRRESTSNISLVQTIRNNDITKNSSRYLSNIDKYIETTNSHKLISKISHQLQTSNISISDNKASLLIDEKNTKMLDEDGDSKKVLTSPKSEDIQRILLVPSKAYLEAGYKTNVQDELQVKTYFDFVE